MIIWGTKRVQSKMVLVADFCSICRGITPFQIIRIGMAGHIYYISLGSGKVVGHNAECQICQSVKEVDATRYAAFEKQKSVDLETLIQKTFPNTREDYAINFDIEKKIELQLPVNEFVDRESLLLEPFQYLANQVEERFAEGTQFDKESGIGCLGTLSLTALLIFVFSIILKSGLEQDRAITATGIIFIVGLIYTIIQLGLAPMRVLNRKIIPNLTQSLKPLNPNREEIFSCIGKFKTAGFTIGKKINPDKLWTALQNHSKYKRQ